MPVSDIPVVRASASSQSVVFIILRQPIGTVPAARFTGFGASASNPSFSRRHRGRGNAALVDGHVESFAVGEMKYKHIDLEN
ncbi:MAG: prepilin-type processing-associated H-X9-DG protein [Lentimonas sp.]|jgi:prepilin-type processing-associated H-X9-DG protein